MEINELIKVWNVIQQLRKNIIDNLNEPINKPKNTEII